METKLQEKQLREKEEEERQRRIAANLKENVRHILCHKISQKMLKSQNLKKLN